ncbi:MAG: GFA family protein [Neorhizobium sp.]|nr:GFA family protein [Neorhizobium sp.]
MQISGSCHCGKIAFTADGEFSEAIECNCSYCRRQGALLAFVPRDRLALLTPRDALKTYYFHRKVIAHHFCDACGIAPFGEATMPGGREMAAINLRCVPEIDVSGVKVSQYDGASV